MATTQMTIPWSDSSGDNMYLNIDTESSDHPGEVVIDVTSDVNNTSSNRIMRLIFEGQLPVVGKQSIATMNITQSKTNV